MNRILLSIVFGCVSIATTITAYSQQLSRTSTDDTGDYSYSIQQCTVTTRVQYKTFDPGMRNSKCNNADLESNIRKINLRKVYLVELEYSRTSFTGPNIRFRCSSEDCAESIDKHANGCELKYQGIPVGHNMTIHYSNTQVANQLFAPLWSDLNSAIKSCSPKAKMTTALELPLDTTGTPETRACDKYYTGRVVKFKPSGAAYLGTKLDAVVLGSQQAKLSIKISENSAHFAKRIFEISCSSDQLSAD